ncbi:hypothetical protein R5R35_012165 [Gryllus longicercus]|uniref:NADH-ubiquinone oxidoreductase 9 kDa subunit n=1 Tax=Gryllus longicercus TaxID=2509291 RepID=A0AAN9ZBN4_9ORTH
MANIVAMRLLCITRQMPVNSLFCGSRRWTQSGGSKLSSSPALNAPGLSQACILPASGEVGPGASKDGNYKNPEYFLYHNMSYFEAEIEMAKFRLPQPSSKKSKN